MSKKDTNYTGNPKPAKKNSKRTLLKLVMCGILFLIVGLCCIFIVNGDKKQPDVVIKSKADAEKYLCENSNYSTKILKELEFNSYWPKEYFEISLKEKKISYWKDEVLKDTVLYNNGENNNLKIFKDRSAKDAFAKFPDNLGKELEKLVREEYLNAINNAKLDEETKDLCILYNALVGYSGSYILLGRANEESDWKYYQSTDFPVYTMPSDKDLIEMTHKYATDTIAKATPLGNYFQKLVDIISVKAISFDFRGDKIWYGNDSAEARRKDIDKLKPPYDYLILSKNSVCGWVVPDGKEKMVKAKEYYSSTCFIDESTYKKLNELKWNKPETYSKWLVITKKIVYYIGRVLSVVGVLLLFVALLPFAVRFFKKRSKQRSASVEDSFKEQPKDNKIKYEHEIVDGNSEYEELQKKISCSEESIRELEEKLENAIEEYKESKEFKELIAKTKKGAIEEYKNNDEYRKLSDEAQNWRTFSSYTKEDKVIAFLNDVHKKIPTFPRLNTLNNIYADAKVRTKNDKELVAIILATLDTQMGKQTGLQKFFNDLVKNAEYGKDVYDRFENCKDIAQRFGERKEYKEIVSQGSDLNIWERLPIMLWAMECTNEILKVFGKDHFAMGIVTHTIDAHKEDIMQIFATRVFSRYVVDDSISAGALTDPRERMIKEKFAEIQSRYGVSMSQSQAYNEFVKKLDFVHDKLKASTTFVNTMKKQIVDEFVANEWEIIDKGEYLSYVVAMGLHMSDYIRYMSGNDIDYCPNVKFVLSGLMPATLDGNTEFRYNDPAYSGDYSNRIYEWLKESGVSKLKALVGNKYIMP